MIFTSLQGAVVLLTDVSVLASSDVLVLPQALSDATQLCFVTSLCLWYHPSVLLYSLEELRNIVLVFLYWEGQDSSDTISSPRIWVLLPLLLNFSDRNVHPRHSPEKDIHFSFFSLFGPPLSDFQVCF